MDFVGEQLVAQVEVEIGGQRIDRQYGDRITSGTSSRSRVSNSAVTSR
jgi:hypothetical protein